MARATSNRIGARKSKASTAAHRNPGESEVEHDLRRMPPWLVCLVLFVNMSFVFAVTFVFIVGIVILHDAFNPSALWPETSTTAKVLMLLASLFGSIVPGLILANLALWAIPRTRRLLDGSAAGAPARTFGDATRWLFRLAAALVPLALVLSVLGAVDPWIG